jgi:hypothetical protein
MGAGIAKQFKSRYPAMFAKYYEQCSTGKWQPGRICRHKLNDGRYILNVSTKDHFNKDSMYGWIKDILERIISDYKRLGITSIAITKLGCGNGHLSWSVVGPMMADALSKLDILVEIHIDPGDEQY